MIKVVVDILGDDGRRLRVAVQRPLAAKRSDPAGGITAK